MLSEQLPPQNDRTNQAQNNDEPVIAEQQEHSNKKILTIDVNAKTRPMPLMFHDNLRGVNSNELSNSVRSTCNSKTVQFKMNGKQCKSPAPRQKAPDAIINIAELGNAYTGAADVKVQDQSIKSHNGRTMESLERHLNIHHSQELLKK